MTMVWGLMHGIGTGSYYCQMLSTMETLRTMQSFGDKSYRLVGASSRTGLQRFMMLKKIVQNVILRDVDLVAAKRSGQM
jgi:hypothetical protein